MGFHLLISNTSADYETNWNDSSYADVDPHEDQWWLRVTFCIFMGFLSISGTVGNSFVVTSFFIVPDLRKLKNIFLLNLALSDLMINAISMPFNILGALTNSDYWLNKDALCSFISAICVPGCSSSLLSMAAIAFERYLCICHTWIHIKLFTLWKCVLMIIVLWVTAWLIHIPNHVGWGGIHYDENFFICWLDLRLWSYSFFYAAVSVFVPLAFCFFAYFSIYMKIRSTKQSRKMIVQRHNEQEKVTRSAWVEEILLVQTLFKIFIIFLISWGPIAVLFTFNKLITPPKWINLLAIVMAHGNSSTNSLVYYFLNGHYIVTVRSARARLDRLQTSELLMEGLPKHGAWKDSVQLNECSSIL